MPHEKKNSFKLLEDSNEINFDDRVYSNECIIKDISILKEENFENFILNSLEIYKNKSISQLLKELDIEEDCNGKSLDLARLTSRMLGINGKLQETEEFFKANIFVKNLIVTETNKLNANIFFPTFDFKELASESWEESTLRDTLDSTKFFFVVFRKQNDGEYIFKGAKFWSIPEYDLETTVKVAWQETVDTLNYGVKLIYNGHVVKNNFINGSDKRIIHVRPHASKSSYLANNTNADELPVPAHWTNKPVEYANNWMTKQCFWLNNDYILEQIKNLLNEK